MGEQLKCGDFVPFVFEHKFNMEVGDGDRKQLMSGTIDRVDICENDKMCMSGLLITRLERRIST